jgi:hypothetical protein
MLSCERKDPFRHPAPAPMSTSLATTGPPGTTGAGRGRQQHQSQAGDGAGEAVGSASGHLQELYILIFKGEQADDADHRTTDLFVRNDCTNSTFRLEGQPGRYRVGEVCKQPAPRFRPRYRSQIHVASVSTRTAADTFLLDTIKGVAVNNADPSWNSHHWVGDVVTTLQGAGIITQEEGNLAIDAMMDIVLRAPL